MKNTHSMKLERWLGIERIEEMSGLMRGWYGPPVPVAGVPGRVYACGDGDFCGPIKGGYFGSAVDFAVGRYRSAMRRATMRQRSQLNMGFTSLSDLISEATTGGKGQDISFQKVSTTNTTAGNSFNHWNVGNWPLAGGTGGASGTGRATTRATSGGLMQANAAGGDTLHFTTVTVQATVASSMMFYDRLWDMTYNHATSTSTTVDTNNPPTRYQTAGTAPGNFFSSDIVTQPVTAHNMTVTYRDQDFNTAEAGATWADSLGVAGRSDMLAGQWFMPLNTGDTGIRTVTIIAQSTTASVTGTTNWFIGHPYMLVPVPLANVPFIYDGINSAFGLQRVYDDACICMMMPAGPTGAITYTGTVRLVSG